MCPHLRRIPRPVSGCFSYLFRRGDKDTICGRRGQTDQNKKYPYTLHTTIHYTLHTTYYILHSMRIKGQAVNGDGPRSGDPRWGVGVGQKRREARQKKEKKTEYHIIQLTVRPQVYLRYVHISLSRHVGLYSW